VYSLLHELLREPRELVTDLRKWTQMKPIRAYEPRTTRSREMIRGWPLRHRPVKPRDSTRMRGQGPSRISGYVNRCDALFTGARSENPEDDIVKNPLVTAHVSRGKVEGKSEKGAPPVPLLGMFFGPLVHAASPAGEEFFPSPLGRSADSFNWTPNA